jgi:hypothetical protein
MKVTNKFNLPGPIVKAVELDEHQQADVSVTGLISPVQMSVLTKQHWDEIEVDASDRIWLLLGKAVHYVLEKAVPDLDTEEYLTVTIDGVTVSGTLDILDRISRTITDYKVTSTYAIKDFTVKPEWEKQLNCYDYMATLNGDKIEHLQIVAILRDWQESKTIEHDYPKSAVIVMPVRKWSRSEQERFLIERVAAWKVAQTMTDLPPCTDDERWAKSPTWAVKKAGNKRATKLFDLEAPAKVFAAENNMVVEYRPGEQVRCQRYCPVRRFCKQGLSYVMGVSDE